MKENQKQAPLFEALLQHQRISKGRFHVPGHKQGIGFDEQGRPWFQQILSLDLTEVGDLDDLHDPQGVIQEAQRLAADAFQAEFTFFLVGGTTVGNLAAILSLCQQGENLVIQRSCHQSVFHGCLLAGAKVQYLLPTFDDQSGLEKPIDPLHLDSILSSYSDVRAVILTSPSYFGMVQPLAACARICHQHNVILMVDEAHGAHFGFHKDLPLSAMQSGADIAVQSTHKMLTSMTMSSMLHIQGKRVHRSQIAQNLRILESSSPSYPLMASLDLARRYIMNEGLDKLTKVLQKVTELRERIRTFTHLQMVYPTSRQDPLKLVLKAKVPVTGYQLQHWLEERGCYLELADDRHILICFSLGTTDDEVDWLGQQLVVLDQSIESFNTDERLVRSAKLPLSSLFSAGCISLDLLRSRSSVLAPLEQAVGRIVTEMVIPYPPGIPLVLPGEKLTLETIEYLQAIIREGGRVRGLPFSSPPMIRVVQ